MTSIEKVVQTNKTDEEWRYLSDISIAYELTEILEEFINISEENSSLKFYPYNIGTSYSSLISVKDDAKSKHPVTCRFVERFSMHENRRT